MVELPSSVHEILTEIAPWARPAVTPKEKAIEVTFTSGPYTIRLGHRDNVLLYAEIRRDKTYLYLSRKKVSFRGKIPFEFIFAMHHRFLRLFAHHLELKSKNLFKEAWRQGVKFRRNTDFFFQNGRYGECWFHLDLESSRIAVYRVNRASVQERKYQASNALWQCSNLTILSRDASMRILTITVLTSHISISMVHSEPNYRGSP